MNKHFEITTQDGIAIITPKTIEAEQWLETNLEYGLRFGSAVAVKSQHLKKAAQSMEAFSQEVA